MLIQHPHDHEHGLDLEAALDFLNTRELESGQFVERLHRPSDARTWFVDQGVLHDDAAGTWTDPDLERIRTVRDALHEVVDAVGRNNLNVGGGNISQASGMLLVCGAIGLLSAVGRSPRVSVHGKLTKEH